MTRHQFHRINNCWSVDSRKPMFLSLALERSYEAHGRCGNGLKRMRARGSLAKTVSGYSYSRRSKGSATEGSVKGSIFRESGAACCMQKRAIWRARRPLYIEEIRAFNGGGRRRRPTAWNRFERERPS